MASCVFLGADWLPQDSLSQCCVCNITITSCCGANHHLHEVHYGWRWYNFWWVFATLSTWKRVEKIHSANTFILPVGLLSYLAYQHNKRVKCFRLKVSHPSLTQESIVLYWFFCCWSVCSFSSFPLFCSSVHCYFPNFLEYFVVCFTVLLGYWRGQWFQFFICSVAWCFHLG